MIKVAFSFFAIHQTPCTPLAILRVLLRRVLPPAAVAAAVLRPARGPRGVRQKGRHDPPVPPMHLPLAGWPPAGGPC